MLLLAFRAARLHGKFCKRSGFVVCFAARVMRFIARISCAERTFAGFSEQHPMVVMRHQFF